MIPDNPLATLPAIARRVIYGLYGLAALAGVGVTAYYAALPDLTAPDWVIGGLAVIGALAAPVSVLAYTNTRDVNSV